MRLQSMDTARGCATNHAGVDLFNAAKAKGVVVFFITGRRDWPLPFQQQIGFADRIGLCVNFLPVQIARSSTTTAGRSAGGSPGSRPGRCPAVIRLSRDPTRRTWRGPPDSDGGSASASATPLGVPLQRVRRAQPRRENAGRGAD